MKEQAPTIHAHFPNSPIMGAKTSEIASLSEEKLRIVFQKLIITKKSQISK